MATALFQPSKRELDSAFGLNYVSGFETKAPAKRVQSIDFRNKTNGFKYSIPFLARVQAFIFHFSDGGQPGPKPELDSLICCNSLYFSKETAEKHFQNSGKLPIPE